MCIQLSSCLSSLWFYNEDELPVYIKTIIVITGLFPVTIYILYFFLPAFHTKNTEKKNKSVIFTDFGDDSIMKKYIKNKLRDLIQGIYGLRDIDYQHNTKSFFIERENGNLIHNLEFNANYRDKLITLFKYTFDEMEGFVVDYGNDGRKKKKLTKKDMIKNFCEFVGISGIEVFEKNSNPCYVYTEESPFEVITSLRKYAPYGEIVVCCNKNQMSPQKDNSSITVEKFLSNNKRFEQVLGEAIFRSLNDYYIPLFFDIESEADKDKEYFDNQFKLACTRSQKRIIDILDFDTSKFDDIMEEDLPDIILILDSEYNGDLTSISEFEYDNPASGIYELSPNLDLHFFTEVELLYKSKHYMPKISTTGINPYIKGKRMVFYISNPEKRNDTDIKNDKNAIDKKIYKRYKNEYESHYEEYMSNVEEMIGIVFSIDLSALIQGQIDDNTVLSYFKQYNPNKYSGFTPSFSEFYTMVANDFKDVINDDIRDIIQKRVSSVMNGGAYLPLNDLSILLAFEKLKFKRSIKPEKEYIVNPDLSDALLEWIGKVAYYIQTDVSHCSKYYDMFIPTNDKKAHYEKIRRYVESDDLKQAIIKLQDKIEKKEKTHLHEIEVGDLSPEELENLRQMPIDVGWSDEVRINRNVFENLKEALLCYIEEKSNNSQI